MESQALTAVILMLLFGFGIYYVGFLLVLKSKPGWAPIERVVLALGYMVIFIALGVTAENMLKIQLLSTIPTLGIAILSFCLAIRTQRWITNDQLHSD